MAYILNNATKGESSEKKALKSIINSIRAQDSKYARHETSECLLNAVAASVDRSRIVSSQECIHILLGQSLYWSNLKYVYIPASLTSGEVSMESDQVKMKLPIWWYYATRLTLREMKKKVKGKGKRELFTHQALQSVTNEELKNMSSDQFFQTYYITKNTVIKHKAANIVVLFPHNSRIARPERNSEKYPIWCKWFLLRNVPWSSDSPSDYLKYFLTLAHMDYENIDIGN